MRDHVTEERISAYVDGELEGDELKLVEDLLAESAEYRQLLAELQELRASMQTLPSFKLPADFHTRVVSQIDEAKPTPSQEPVFSARQPTKASPWRSVFFAVASLAALVTFAVMLRPPSVPPVVNGLSGVGTAPVSMPVYMQQEPTYVLVYDVTVTKSGQQNDVVTKLLQKYGIAIDPALRLDGKLESELMAFRESPWLPAVDETIPYGRDLNTPKSSDKDQVEMIYIAGVTRTLGQFGAELGQVSDFGQELSRLHFDMVVEPQQLGVMHRLHHAAQNHFAVSNEPLPTDAGLAFRLAFRFDLASVPGTAMMPVPMIRTDSATSNASEGEISRELNAGTVRSEERDGQAGVTPPPAGWQRKIDEAENSPGHILLIIRNVGAKAEEAN